EGRQEAALAAVEQFVEGPPRHAGPSDHKRHGGPWIADVGSHRDHRRENPGALDLVHLTVDERLPPGTKLPAGGHVISSCCASCACSSCAYGRRTRLP